MRIDFHASPEPTLGVEWELAIVDRDTRDLVSAAASSAPAWPAVGWSTRSDSTRSCCATPSRS